jgi:hypothetical protein
LSIPQRSTRAAPYQCSAPFFLYTQVVFWVLVLHNNIQQINQKESTRKTKKQKQ